MFRGESGAQGHEGRRWLCPVIMMITVAVIIMMTICRKLLVLSVQDAPVAEAELIIFVPVLTHK